MAAESKGTYLYQVFKPREHRYIGVKTGGRLASSCFQQVCYLSQTIEVRGAR